MSDRHRDTALADLLGSTTTAFVAALHAVLEHDVPAARQVLRESAARRRARVEVDAWVRDHGSRSVPHLLAELQYVADLGRVGDLADQLARHVVGGHQRMPLTAAQRADVKVLLDAGGLRLRELALDHVEPGPSRAHVACGGDLLDTAARCGQDRCTPLALCAELASTLLQATRHAAHAAHAA